MLGNRLLRIFLHLIINSGIDTKSILVKIVLRTVSLGVLVQPSIERIVSPLKRVHNIILILSI